MDRAIACITLTIIFTFCVTCLLCTKKTIEGYKPHKHTQGSIWVDHDVFLWDFDKTITNKHVTRLCSRTEKECANNIADPDFFKETVDRLHNNGKTVGIVSFSDRRIGGGYKLINKHLDHLFGKGRPYLTRDSVVSYHPLSPNRKACGKNKHIETVCKRLGVENVPRNRILIFEDNKFNVHKARQVGYHAIHVPKFYTRNWMHDFEKYLSSYY